MKEFRSDWVARLVSGYQVTNDLYLLGERKYKMEMCGNKFKATFGAYLHNLASASLCTKMTAPSKCTNRSGER